VFKAMTKRFNKYWFPVIVWAGFILLLCSTPGNKIPHVSWLELLSFDKFVHASVFFILNHLVIRALSQYNKLNATIVTGFCILYGGILELMQSHFFIQRSGDLLDFIANSFGCIVAIISYHSVKSKMQKLYKKSY
jgi:hypothetical protein